ncbi:hypothetical protein [Microbacterium laevaniformans]
MDTPSGDARRAALEERRRVLSRAIAVMDDKIAHFRGGVSEAGTV